jgi:hypothetical protein
LIEIRKLPFGALSGERNIDFEQRVMAIIRCTTKLLNDLGAEPTSAPDLPPGVCDWHASLLRLERKKYVLFTHDQTLYSLLMRWMKTPRSADFVETFRLGLFKSLMNEGLAEMQIKYLLSEHTQVMITKTNSRSVLGSMNDLTFQIKSMISASRLTDADWSEINRQMNPIPMRAIKYNISIDEMKRRLAEAYK